MRLWGDLPGIWQYTAGCDYTPGLLVAPASRKMMTERKIPPVHPSEVLLEDFLKHLSMSQYRLAKELSVYPWKIYEIVHGQRAVTADTALRLSRYFGTSAELWLNLQSFYDLEKRRDEMGAQLEEEITPLVRDDLNLPLA